MKFSIIIGYREANRERKNNLLTLLSYLKCLKNKDFEVIVVEQDVKFKLSQRDFYRHIPLYNAGLYNRSWGFNVGAMSSLSNIFVFSDSDLIIDYGDLLKCVDACEQYDAVNPKGKVYDLDQNQKFEFGIIGKNRDWVNFSGGIVLMKKEPFFYIQGWDEGFVGWGGEDDVMTFKINVFLKHKRMNFIVYHLYHGDQYKDPKNMEFYKKNYKRFDYYKNLYKGELLKFKEVCLKPITIGKMDKYK